MRRSKGHTSSARAALIALVTSLLCLALSAPAQADPPGHERAKALDVSGLDKACGVAVDNKGDLYASSAGESKVKVFAPGDHTTPIAEIANANTPCGLAVTTTGALYVSEKATGEVVRYKPDAYPLTGAPAYGSREVIDASGNAAGIATDRVDNRLYVARGNHVAIYKADGSFEVKAGEGSLTEATGVAAYTYTDAVSNNRLYVSVADVATDEVKIFSGPTSATSLKLRRMISGVDHDEDPETAAQEFGFGAAGAYLAADPGNETAERKCAQVAAQACTAGHFFLYDASHDAVDEFDAKGEFVDQLNSGSFSAALPTALAVDRSGGAGDGTVYVSVGPASGAKLLAFAPLAMPSRAHDSARSRVLAGARAVATDDRGNVYVAAGTTIHIYGPSGSAITSFADAEGGSPGARDLALDSKGNVYVVDGSGSQAILTYYSPSQYPPTGATTYTRHSPSLIPETNAGTTMVGVAVNPANDHAFVTGSSEIGFPAVVLEFGSAAEGSPKAGECGTGLGLSGNTFDIGVHGATGTVYLTSNGKHIYALKCAKGPAEAELLGEIKGGGCPSGEVGSNPAIAVDQSNGHVLVYANNQAGGAREYDSAGACVAQFGTFSSGTGTYKVAVDNSCALHKPPLTEQTTPTCAATNPANGTVYVASDGENNTTQPYDVNAFGPLEYPEIEEEEPDPEEFMLKVKPAGTGTGTVTSSPSGISCGSTCEADFEEGTEVTLTGPQGANSKSVVWTGCDSVNGENKCLVTMDADTEVTATFDLEQHLLSVSKTGSGTGKVTSTPLGIDCGSDCSEPYDHGTVVTLSATPDAGSEFTGFSGACTGLTCEVTMSAAKSVTANFDEESTTPKFLLTVDPEGTGSGTITADKGAISCGAFCSDEYEEGTVVVLTATAAPGSVFTSWRYCDTGGVNGRKCTMTVDKAQTVKATFTTTHALEVSKAPGSGLGKVQSAPGGILCLSNCPETTAAFKEGAVVTLKQTPAKHFHFVKWLDDCSGSGACELTMGEDHSVEAEFAEDAKHLLTLTKSGGGQGTVKSSLAGINCGLTCSVMSSAYYQGEVVELTATPGKGSSFGGWSGGVCAGTGTCTVTMSEAKEVTAEFK